ncbi:MAG: TonB-dependent receptor plug, partial [Pedobacter sp.]|nr:TonB-dependent receptor plug [Pedobacter sp.]
MKIEKHLKGVKSKRRTSQLSLSAKLAFASSLLLSLNASASINAPAYALRTTTVKSAIWAAQVADLRITGKVLDETGKPLIGASVKVKGASTGVSTDVNGDFVINAPENGTLILSYTGYESKEVAIGGKTSITVSLAPAANNLNEVVVTALG